MKQITKPIPRKVEQEMDWISGELRCSKCGRLICEFSGELGPVHDPYPNWYTQQLISAHLCRTRFHLIRTKFPLIRKKNANI